jgi:hypothetical protein
MDTTDTHESERATEAASERLAAAAAQLLQHTKESSRGTGPASDRYLDSLEGALKSAQEYVRTLTRLRDVLRKRLGR